MAGIHPGMPILQSPAGIPVGPGGPGHHVILPHHLPAQHALHHTLLQHGGLGPQGAPQSGPMGGSQGGPRGVAPSPARHPRLSAGGVGGAGFAPPPVYASSPAPVFRGAHEALETARTAAASLDNLLAEAARTTRVPDRAVPDTVGESVGGGPARANRASGGGPQQLEGSLSPAQLLSRVQQQQQAMMQMHQEALQRQAAAGGAHPPAAGSPLGLSRLRMESLPTSGGVQKWDVRAANVDPERPAREGEGDVTAGLRVPEDLLCPPHEQSRTDLIDGVAATLVRLKEHPLLRDFPIADLQERLVKVKSLYVDSNQTDQPFVEPVGAALDWFSRFVNSASIQQLLSPVQQRLDAVTRRRDENRAVREAAHQREDVLGEKNAISAEIGALKKLIHEYAEMNSLIERTKETSLASGMKSVEEPIAARLEAIEKSFSAVRTDAVADRSTLEAAFTADVSRDSAQRGLFEAQERVKLAAQKTRAEEQAAIVQEISRLLKRYEELQADNNATAQAIVQAAAEEQARRNEVAARAAKIETRQALVENTATNAATGAAAASALRELLGFWFSETARLVMAKEAELKEAERFVQLQRAQTYTDFCLVIRKLIYIQSSRLAKAKQARAHAKAEKESALSLLSQEGVDHWNSRASQLDGEIRILEAELEALEASFNEEREAFGDLEAKVRAATAAEEAVEHLGMKVNQEELRRVQAWQTAVLGLIDASHKVALVIQNDTQAKLE